MAYSVAKLITRAYALSGIVARSLETVSGEQLFDGRELLNDLLAVKTATQQLIPFFTEYVVDYDVDQVEPGVYFIRNLIDVETFTFNIGSIRFSTQNKSRSAFFGSARADNVQSLPFSWHAERTKGGTTIYVYFTPAAEYPLKIWGKFGLTEVSSYDQDLSLIYERNYLAYLRYALAEYICADYNITFQPQSQAKLAAYESMFVQMSPIDYTLSKQSTLKKGAVIDWGYVNLGPWGPG